MAEALRRCVLGRAAAMSWLPLLGFGALGTGQHVSHREPRKYRKRRLSMHKWEHARLTLTHEAGTPLRGDTPFGPRGAPKMHATITTYTAAGVKKRNRLLDNAPLDQLDHSIVELGRDGWELVSVLPVLSPGPSSYQIFWFKRPSG